ncbi:MAG: hypothetical protein KJZ84_13845 [Bryobacteraceae bacterium]|nr:hypothetical protein [Bryobacteraceae bacterium]
MPVSFESLRVGGSYDRPFLASLWGYKGWAALARGVVTPANENVIILFITKEKQKDVPQYRDIFDGEVLRMEGEDGRSNDDRLINSSSNGDEVHLFYRKRHHSPFVYEGRIVIEEHETGVGTTPSRFVFRRISEAS